MRVHFSFVILVVFISFCLIPILAFAYVPVEYGGNDDLDACMAVGRVGNLTSDEDGFLAVKDAPNLKAIRIDKLYNFQQVWICSESKDGKWFGVVYTKTSTQECGASKNIKKRTRYKGPCLSGWVSAKWIIPGAG